MISDMGNPQTTTQAGLVAGSVPLVSDRATWSWQLQAKCRGMPDTIFYPPEHERGPRRRRREHRAKLICHECPVRTDCLVHALVWPEAHGIWGETTPGERMTMLDSKSLRNRLLQFMRKQSHTITD